jgi:folylpolyglutamate synthase/dihydropteroate synthase
VVCTSDDRGVRARVEEGCRATGARCIHALDEARVEAEADTLGRFQLKVNFPRGLALDLRIPLPGEHQVRNAVAAIRALMVLQTEDFPLTRNIKEGVEATRWLSGWAVPAIRP